MINPCHPERKRVDAGTRGRGDAARRRPCRHQRRGALLLVVLAIIAVLALIAASLAYRMDAERMGIESLGNLQQARLAAESGLARTLLLLRDNRTDMDKWYNNPESFRRVPVWMPSDQKEGTGGTESPISKEVVENQAAWRYSVVSYDQLNEDRVVIRYGLTDEGGKLNINFATRGELLRLVKTLDLEDLPPETLVDALIDWRDQDSSLNSPAGAETPWYMTLQPSYRAKNRPFESMDELLMVKDWNGQFLYGEDYNRNGYLDENEDDGEEGAFPPDDADGQLERGLARLITVHSWDWNFANDNKPRDDINSLKWDQPDKLPQHIQDELGPEVIDFLAEAKKRGFKFRSVGELWGLEVYEDGSSNYDDAWEQYREQVKEENAVPKPEDEQGDEQDGGQGDENQDGDNQDGDGSGQDENEGRDGKSGDKNDGDENAGDDQGEEGQDGGEAENDESSQNEDQNPDDQLRNRKKEKNQQAIRSETGGSRTGGRGRTGDRSGTRGNDRDGDSRADDNGNGGRDRGRDGGSRDGNRDGGDRDGGRAGGRDGGNRDDGNRTGGRNGGNRDGGGRTGGNRGDNREDGNADNRDGGRDRDRDGNASEDGDQGQGRDGGRGRGRDGGRGQGGRDRGGNRTGEGDGAGDSGENGGRGGRPGNGGQPGSGGRTGEGDNTGEGGDSTSQPGEGDDDEAKKGTPVVSPVTPEQMNVVMDRLTTVKSAVRVGQINVDTAEPEVLQSLIGMTPEEAKAIVQARRSLAGPDKTTPAWLVTSGTLEPAKFAVLSNKLTARSIQFTADVIGFADHTGTYRRIQAIIEMRGHMAQIRYYRDISSLGIGYPVKDDERSDGLAFGNE